MELKKVNLRDLRKKAGLTQETLAEMIGTKQAVISKIERQVFTPSIDMAIKLIAALNDAGLECTLDDLFEYGFEEGKLKTNSTNKQIPIVA